MLSPLKLGRGLEVFIFFRWSARWPVGTRPGLPTWWGNIGDSNSLTG